MDGGSSDGTVDVLRQHSKLIAHVSSGIDTGIADAWNKSLKLVRGDWIIFLGADDRLFDPNALSDAARILRENKDNDIVYGRVKMSGGNYNDLEFGDQFDPTKFKIRMNIPHSATFHRREMFDHLGRFDETFKIAADYEFLLRKRDIRVGFLNRTIVLMGGTGISSKDTLRSYREFRRAQHKNKTLPKLLIEFLHCYFFLRVSLKRCSRLFSLDFK
jgi:glycosyltransferase involved in cell wall biosynthesis